MNRREFIRASSLAITAGPIFARDSAPRIRIGFLGTGYSHFRDKYQLLTGSPDFELVGLAEEEEKAKSNRPANAQWLSVADLFSRAEVVVVESPVKDHARHAKTALEAGRHVHLEKPPAPSLAEFKELVEIAQAKRLILQIGYMWRYNPGINAILEAARNGWLGEVFLVRATMNTTAGPEARKEWALFKGGAMFEQGCHLIDPVVRLLGKPKKISSILLQTRPELDSLADNTVATFEYERAVAIITSAPLQPNAGGQRFFEVIGTNGYAKTQPLEPPSLVLDLAKEAGPYRAGKQEVKLPPYSRYLDEFKALASAVRGQARLPVPLETELAVQEALLEACQM